VTRAARFLVALAALGLLAPAPARPATDPDHLGTAGVAGVAAVTADSVRYNTKVSENNMVGVCVTNYGFIGNNFVSRAPSLEYPLGTEFEHLTRAGLWVGAEAIDDLGSFYGVTTGAVDGSAGSSAQSGTEYAPACLEIRRRSSLTNSSVYDPESVSEEDLIGFCSDQFITGKPQYHRPMKLLVRLETYDWSFSSYAHFVIFHYVITNTGLPLRNAWVGVYAELASGDRSDYSLWPPTSASGGDQGSWYQKKLIAYDADSLRLFREHRCYNILDCQFEHVPYWVGYSILGATEGAGTASVLPAKQITMAAWDYAPGDSVRDEDVERYDIMSAGTLTPLDDPLLQPTTGDPVELLAIGPFAQIDPGDSITVDFCFVGGAEIEDIRAHKNVAQRAYDLHYVVPQPPPSPRFKVVAREQALDLYWDASPELAQDPTNPDPFDFEGYRVYLGEDRLDLKLVAQFDLANAPHDTVGFDTGLDSCRLETPVVLDGVTYEYRHTIRGLRDGFKYFAAVTAYDLGTTEIESLESGISQNKTMAIPAPAPGEPVAGDKVYVFPNPYRVEARWDAGEKVRDHYLWFTNLPERCALRIYTLSGDLVFETDFDGATYAGAGARGVYNPISDLDVDAPTLSGTTYAWNLITREGQAAATGLYLYSVEDQTGKRDRAVGKFLIVKSDRED
jgi:hypothetical protein